MRVFPRALAAASLISYAAAAQQASKSAAPALLPLSDEPELALPLPTASKPSLDLGVFLKNTSLCIFPFLKESSKGAAEKSYLDAIQKTFFDVARDSPLLKDTILLGQGSRCDLHDAACFAAVGRSARCQNVLVGSSAAKGNGFVLSVRMFEVAKQRVMPGSEVEQVLETDRQADVQAWAEGQACRALQVTCAGTIDVDADRREMNIYVDNRLVPRSFASPERLTVEPGVHAVRISIGQRTSLEKKVPVRRGAFSEVVYARQTSRGGLPLTVASELQGSPRPAASVDYTEGSWTKPAGYSVAAAGLLVAGIATYEGLHSRSLINGANANFRGNQGYFQSDLANVDSARSAASTANVLFVVGGVLLAAGLTTVFAF